MADWERARGVAPTSLAEMEIPLRRGEDVFVRVERDPWGNDYRLRPEPRGVVSSGPDGRPDTDDDIAYPDD